MTDVKTGPKPIQNIFGFLDESGLLKSPLPDKIFALGLLKLHNPRVLHKAIINLKNKESFHEELKFTKINNYNLSIYEKLIETYFSTYFTSFSALIFDKTKIDIKNYNNKDYTAYNSFVGKLIAESMNPGEYIVVIADDITTPKDDVFEKDVKKKVRARLRRNALFGIIRAESHAFCELQMVDILLGSVSYAFKIKNKLIITPNKNNPKLRLVKLIQRHLNIQLLSESLERKMSNGRYFKIKEYGKSLPKKIDSALDLFRTKPAPTHSV